MRTLRTERTKAAATTKRVTWPHIPHLIGPLIDLIPPLLCFGLKSMAFFPRFYRTTNQLIVLLPDIAHNTIKDAPIGLGLSYVINKRRLYGMP
jgi:hypothetical protein